MNDRETRELADSLDVPSTWYELTLRNESTYRIDGMQADLVSTAMEIGAPRFLDLQTVAGNDVRVMLAEVSEIVHITPKYRDWVYRHNLYIEREERRLQQEYKSFNDAEE